MSEDNTAIESRQSQELSPAEVFSTIAQLAKDPATNVDTIERLIALQERMTTQQREAKFNEAMANMQPKLPVIAKNGRIEVRDKETGRVKHSTSYATYEDIDTAIRGLLFENGFSFSFDSVNSPQGGIVGVRAKLSHRAGHSITSQVPVSSEKSSPMMNSAQAIGAAVKYGRRNLVVMMLNLVTMDDEEGQREQGRVLDKITDGQVAQIEDMIQVLSEKDPKTRAGFLQYVGVDRIMDIPQFAFRSALNLLYSKKKLQEKE